MIAILDPWQADAGWSARAIPRSGSTCVVWNKLAEKYEHPRGAECRAPSRERVAVPPKERQCP
jgi:hypothetical protein